MAWLINATRNLRKWALIKLAAGDLVAINGISSPDYDMYLPNGQSGIIVNWRFEGYQANANGQESA